MTFYKLPTFAMLSRLCLIALIITVSAQQSQIPIQDQNHCRTIQVHSGDSCGSLAQRCGISGRDFEKYNADPHLCSTLQPLQHVCCSPGPLPDFKPKPNPDGSCATYTAKHGDNCAAIGAAHGLTVTEINSMNHHTWGWEGCEHLQAEQTFCLSNGTPPMPAPIKGAICGPQVPGTKPPKDMSNLADLNPCPLKACCNKWGQCGTTSEFCIKSKSSTGNPGTSAPHTNGCISNCGMEIVNNNNPPPVSRSVGYFEAWNMGRPCLNMDASQIDASQYDVVHFSFAEITPNFEIKITDKEQFEVFKKQHGFKKVVSFGGWSFSTSQDSFPIFRNAVTDANRATFAKNVANFVRANDLDGVDFDWEYPGAIDIPNIPPGDKGDGQRYLAFLKTLKSMLAKSKTLSIAAPASYWYLKGFPIAEISKVVDYIVYMTYDLHGQWDYENKYAAEGCPHGSCLRSHVNYTETINALSMITKAGVPAAKIVVGIGSYGRSFQMADPNCSGPKCTFTGPKSGAHPGVCTETAGYISNAEIEDIIAKDKTAKTHYDQSSDSVILQYGDKNWVAFMDDNTRKSRISSYKTKNFGGTVDWAMDLGRFHPPTEGHQGGHGPDLNINSTCQDLENFQGAHGLTSNMWGFAHAGTYFSDWIHKKWNPGTDSFFMASFAQPWGLRESTRSCVVGSSCEAPNCADMGNAAYAPGSGPAYLVIMSFYNMMAVLHNIYAAIGHARDEWNSLPDWFQSHFNTNSDVADYNALPVKEAILGIGTAVSMLLALTGNPVAGAVGAFAGGLAGGIITAIPNPTENTVKELGQFQKFMHDTLDTAEQSVSSFFTGFQAHGHSQGKGTSQDISLEQAFQGGEWVDWSKIPILNPNELSTNKINAVFAKHVSAAAINWAWHTQRVWLMSYPMTEDEFNSHYAFSGNNDSRLKHYYKGRGYFFMSVFPQSAPLQTAKDPRIQDPPGWGNVEQVGITTYQIIESSADGYAIGGYDYNPEPDIAKMLESTTRDLLTDSVSLPGVFNIPICALDSRYGWTPSVDKFFHALAGPGALLEDNDNGQHSPLCYCMGVKDKFGKKFDDQISLKGWYGYPWCPIGEFNTPGGAPSSTPTLTTEPPPGRTINARDEL
ncbi:hypothetical protein BP6252_13144 [Coleophoma cylindrospora]|uniref:chitinase n=1 Tax=Coleophoma cylindrospora TaxID=1849047 RepID=A0A3D8QAM6_9HELO|nr:hypothetical protein BP6252_13144 [Coleophoma cylindrospora]